MTALEVILILVGVAFIIVSFFVEEKLTRKDIERITSLSEEELKIIVERQLKNAESEVDDSIADIITEAMEDAQRAMQRESNEKIMAINEYSDTVLESMNKTHNEIVFLYDMLNDKHSELLGLTKQLQEFSRQMKNTENEVLSSVAYAARELENSVQKQSVFSETEETEAQSWQEDDLAEVSEDGEEEEERPNHNETILELHKRGASDVEIARQLGLGLGEVRLVIGLYKGAPDAV